MGTILYVNSSKKYDEWLADNTDFFSNLESDYDVTVDPGTQDLIELFFGNRYVCDDDNFTRYYKRTLLNSWDRYIDLLRIEKTEIDPLVADYFENELTHSGTNTGSKSGTVSETTTHGKTDTLTHNVTVTEDNTITNDETDTRTLNLADSHTRTDDLAHGNTRTDNLANSNTRTDNLTTTTDSKQAGANAVNPQSLEYSGTTAGNLPSLDWQYMSNQEQTEGEGTEHQTGTVQNAGTQTGTVTDQGTNTGTVTNAGTNTGTDTLVKDGDKVEDKEKKTTGTETHALSGSDVVAGENEETYADNTNRLDRERHTGRTGILPQEALRKAKAYIEKSRAFDWLKDELEPCFISIYDI